MITVLITIVSDETGIHVRSNARGKPANMEEQLACDALKEFLTSPEALGELGKPDFISLIERDQE